MILLDSFKVDYTIVVSAPSVESMKIEEVRELIANNNGLPPGLFNPKDCTIHINPTGRYVNRSALHDSGLTVCKLILDTIGTNSPNISDEMLSERIATEYSLTPRWITEKLKLNQPRVETILYADVAARGQVGQSEYPWEKLDALAFFESLKT